MNRRLYRILLTVLVASLLLGACGPADPGQENPPLEIGWSLYPGYYPLVLAQELGLFAKHGVEVTLVRYDSYSEAKPQIASGFVDGAALVLGDVLLEDIANYVKVVLVVDHSNGADQLIASPELMQTQDLRGRRVGVQAGIFGELLVRAMLEEYNLRPSDIILVEVPPEQVAAAIPGQIDMGHTFEPYASQAIARGNGNFFDSSQAPGIIVDTIVFRNEILQNRPDDVRKFINAWFEAVAYWQANPIEGNTIIARATGQSVDEISFEGILFFDRDANRATFQPGNDTRSLVYTAQLGLQFLIETGVVTVPVDINNVLDASYLE